MASGSSKRWALKRSGGAGLSEAAVNQIFGAPVGAAGVALADKGGRTVFKVTDATTPPLDPKSPEMAALLPRLDAALAEDVFTEYVSGLQTQLGAKVNQTVVALRPRLRTMKAASMFQPEFDAFAALYDAGEPSLVSLRLVADLETPVSAFMKLSRGRAGDVFLLESVEGGAARGRYSMIGLDPDVIFRVQNGRAEINRDARRDPDAFVAVDKKPLDALRDLLDELAIPATGASDALPPMAAGIFGYLGYDMVREMERLAPAKPDPIGTPDSLLVRPTLMAVFDSVRDEISLVTPVRPQDGVAAKAAYEAALDRLEAAVAVLEGPLRHEGQAQDALLLQTHAPVSNTTEAQYLAMVEQAKSYIRAGDIFQVVLSQRFTSPFQLPAFSLYRALRRVNPAPFLCYLDFGGFQIVCSSPEILVRAREGKVTIRPIAGTRWRGETKAQDDALAAELLADEKERAEHLMLLDLGRNDVGRVAEIGTVEVTEKFVIERYSHVMHIVSNVEGKLDSSCDVIDASGCRLSRRHGFRRAKSAGDGDHRRAGNRQARHLRRLHRLFRRLRRDGHLYRAAHLGGEGRPDACSGRRRHRL